MVVGAFMSIFLVGALYHLASVGRAVLYRERMQDFADRAAFEGALGYARSMNEIALANNIQIVATANVFALAEAVQSIDSCTPAAKWGGYPQVLCPQYHAGIHAAYDSSVPDLNRLIRGAVRSAESLRDATPALVDQEVSALVQASGTGERSLEAAGIVRVPMPLQTGLVTLSCVRAGPFVEPLLRESLPSDLVESFLRPAMAIERPNRYCPWEVLPPEGPQLMNPPNQSGTEALQIRAVVVGAEQSVLVPMRESGVRVAERTIRAGREAPELSRERRRLSRVGLAQAEYYSAWEHANRVSSDTSGFPGVMPEENTFYMHWRARLRRLRVPVNAGTDLASDVSFDAFVRGPLRDACEQICARGGSCDGVCGAIPRLGRIGNNALQ